MDIVLSPNTVPTMAHLIRKTLGTSFTRCTREKFSRTHDLLDDLDPPPESDEDEPRAQEEEKKKKKKEKKRHT